MCNFLKFNRIKYPKELKNIWYNRSAYITDRPCYPKIFDENNIYIRCKKGLKVKMFETDKGKAVFYEITNTRYQTGDWLLDSDGVHCDMKFHHIEKTTKQQQP